MGALDDELMALGDVRTESYRWGSPQKKTVFPFRPQPAQQQIAPIQASTVAKTRKIAAPTIGRVEGYTPQQMTGAQSGYANSLGYRFAAGPEMVEAGMVDPSQLPGIRDVVGVQVGPAQMAGVSGVAPAQVAGVDPVAASTFGGVADVLGQRIDATQTGLSNNARTLEGQAADALRLGGSLSDAEKFAASEAEQAAWASRGLGRSVGAVAAEVLSRDAYSRQREDERRQFAMGVESLLQPVREADAARAQAADLANAGFEQQAGLANQAAALSTGQFNAGQEQQAGLANQAAALSTQQTNAGLQQQADLANQQAALSTQQTNANLQQQAGLANQGAQMQAGMANQAADQAWASMGLQAMLANQGAGLQADLANQQAGLQHSLSEAQRFQNWDLAVMQNQQQVDMLNANLQQATQQFNAGAMNQAQYQRVQLETQRQLEQARMDMQAAMQNQQIAAQRASQNASLAQQAAMGNQSAALTNYQTNLAADMQVWDWRQNQAESQRLYNQAQDDLWKTNPYQAYLSYSRFGMNGPDAYDFIQTRS